jgi:predicted ATPase
LQLLDVFAIFDVLLSRAAMSKQSSLHFEQIDFVRFKAFRSFSLKLNAFNILVGPNNAGKSTILAAFRILAAAMRKANNRQAEIVMGPKGLTPGYKIDLKAISVAEENILYNYESEPATVTFSLSYRNKLRLYFPDQ